MIKYQEITTGEIIFSDEMCQLDNGYYTYCDMIHNFVLDDQLSDLPQYEIIEH